MVYSKSKLLKCGDATPSRWSVTLFRDIQTAVSFADKVSIAGNLDFDLIIKLQTEKIFVGLRSLDLNNKPRTVFLNRWPS
jgi:glyoxylate carboligase